MNRTARNLPLYRANPSPARVPGYGVPAVPRSESQPARGTPKTPYPGTRISRRAFTAAELMIALVLSSIVAMAALGLLGTIYASDTAAQKRFDDEAQLQNLQRAVRALSRSITAKRAPDPSSGFGAEPSDAEITAAENELRATYDKAGQPYTPESIRSAAVENARKSKREANANAPDEREHIPPRFEVRFDSTGSGGAVPVLEALLSDAPVPPAWSADLDAQRWAMSANLIRGVIEGVRSDDFEKTGWTLQWRQIEPAADPVKLASGIAGWEWSVLPRKAHDKDNVGFVETAAAWYGTDYPRALRLRVATMKGAQADWLFDMPRPIPEIADADDAQQAAEEAKESGVAPILQDLPIAGQPNFVDPKQGTGVPIRNQRGTDFKSRINGQGGR